MSMQAVESSIAQHSILERVCIQRMSIQAAELSRAHHSVLERVGIQQ